MRFPAGRSMPPCAWPWPTTRRSSPCSSRVSRCNCRSTRRSRASAPRAPAAGGDRAARRRAGVPVDARIDRGRTLRHAMREVIAARALRPLRRRGRGDDGFEPTTSRGSCAMRPARSSCSARRPTSASCTPRRDSEPTTGKHLDAVPVTSHEELLLAAGVRGPSTTGAAARTSPRSRSTSCRGSPS